MRKVNDLNKAELRRLLNEPEVLSEDNEWTCAYTIERRPEAGYPDLPVLKPELEGTYNPGCSERTFRQLAAFWPDNRLESVVPPKC
jgi:hypothetical protein